MNFIRFIINRKTLTSMLFLALTMLGIISYRQLPVELIPNAELPFLFVQIMSTQDVDPAYLETQVVIPVEGAITTLQGIDKIETFVERRRASIIVYFNERVKLKYAYLRLEEKVAVIRATLGDEFNIQVLKVDTEQISNMFMGLQVRGGGGLDRVRYIVDRDISNELENIDGIASVEIFGGRQKSIEIVLNEDACRAHNVTGGRIRSLITQNSQVKDYVGQLYGSDKHYFVNVVADFTDVSQLEDIIVNTDGPVRLKDIADVYFGVKEQTSLSRINGKDAVTLQLVKDTQVNLINLSHTTREVVDRLNKKLKNADIEIVIQTDTAEDIEKNIDLIIELAVIGAILAVFILWFFLRNLRLVLVIALAMPISIFTAFNLFYAFDISVNSFTLVGLALAVGMLLDNSVVVLENVYRHLSRGKNAGDAVVRGTYEVWRSIFAATLTTITVFLPFIFASNFMIKLLGRHIGVSIISTLLISLAVALFLIPMIIHSLLVRQKSAPVFSFHIVSRKNRLIQVYNLLLKTALRSPVQTIIVAVILFFFSLLLCIRLSLDTSSEVDTSSFNLYLTMPSGATLETTDKVVAELETRLLDIEEREDLTSQIYEEEAILTFELQEDFEKIKDRSIPDIKEEVERRTRNFPGGDVSFDQPTTSRRFRGGQGRNPGAGLERMLGIGSQVEYVVLKGRDFDKLRNMADDIKYYLDQLSTIERTGLNIADNRPELHLFFDYRMLNNYDITLNSIASELATFDNEFSSNLKYKQGTEEYDIVIRNASLEEKNIDDLRTLDIPSQSGGNYDLQDVSRIVYSYGIAGINRVNQEKQIELNFRFLAEINDSKELLEAARMEIDELIASINPPAGVAIEVIHDDRDFSEFYFLIGAAFILIYMILASVFESLLTPVVMMFTIPLAAIGSLWALILTGNSLLNANTLIGFLILLGVVVNNGIIFIDYTRILSRRGYRRSRALLTAGQARVRPILITAITTIIAMLPLAMGKAEYVARIGAPFAITVIGGLSLSTLFTLVFIPTVYSGLESMVEWLKKLDWRIKTIQILCFAAVGLLIHYNVESLIFKFADLIIAILLIPGMTYFIMKSLRQSKSEYIRSDEELLIKVQSLVKIYDSDRRFVREWKKGKRIAGTNGSPVGSRRWINSPFFWQIPLGLFLFYFVYVYIDGFFPMFLLSHVVYLYTIYFWKSLSMSGKSVVTSGKTKRTAVLGALSKWLEPVFIWGFPLVNLIGFFLRWHKIAAVIFIGILWVLLITILTTANRLSRQSLKISRIAGRFAGLRKAFYRLIQMIPVLGRRKSPFRALNGISLEIGSGMFGLLGPNGAGKTTLMRIICGILQQNRGKIWFNDIDIQEQREELQGLIGYPPQEFGLYENMTAREFLDYQAILKNILDREERLSRVNQVLTAVHLDEHGDQRLGSYSGGMKQRIGIAQTLLHLPRILVVDEPTAGLDPRERIRFRNLLVELSRERIVIFSTHIIEDISSSCQRVAVLNRGELSYLGETIRRAQLSR